MSRYVWIGFTVLAVLVGAYGAGVALWLHAAEAQSTTAGAVQIAQVGDVPIAIAGATVGEAGDDAIDKLLDAVQVNEAISYKGLTLFPVSLRRDYSDFLPRAFDEAVEKDELVVKEVGEGEVNSVRVKNMGLRPVFIMSGEIMTGSKQDRTAQRDVLIPRQSGWVQIPVYCVEAGRWTVVTPQFKTRRALANPGLRGMAYEGAPQTSVWSEVDRAAKSQGVPQSGNKAFQEIYDSKEVRDKLEDYAAALRLPRNRDIVGFVAFRDGRVIGADLFGNEAMFEKLRDKLIRSYVLAIGRDPSRRSDGAGSREAARFLAQAWSESCSRIGVDTPGIGETYRLRNSRHDASGGALIYRGDVVHLSLFPRADVEPIPLPGPAPTPVPRGEQQQRQTY